MDSTPRRWVLKPLSPSLQPSDLRSISAQRDDSVFFNDSISVVGSQSSVYVEGYSDSSADVVVEARQVAVSQDGDSTRDSTSDELPISPCSSSASSHSGFYSFVEDPFSPEAEQNEAWMVSPQRQTQLATLKKENSFKLQTYMSHRKPESLFQDGSMDSQYEINPKYGYVVVSEEEGRQLRKEIIRSQAPKKSPVVNTGAEVDLGDNTSRLIEGFSISYIPVSSKSKPTFAVNSEAIDEEQINFDAARKQFVQMEQNKLDPIIRPRKINLKMSPKPKQDALVQEKEVRNEELLFRPREEDVTDAEVKEIQSESHSRQSSLLEDSVFDSLSLNVGYSSVDGFGSDQIQPESEANQLSVEPETPIEREIRIAQEREENLRRSRGLQHSVSRGEMVEIKTKRLQSPLPLTPARVKEKGRVSFIFQEIQKKEEAIKQDGARQDLGGLRHERANSFNGLQTNNQEKKHTVEEQGNIVQSNQEYVITRALETLKKFESIEEPTKFDDVDNAFQKQGHTTQEGRNAENQQSATKQGQGYAEQYIPGTRQDHGYTVQSDQELPRKGAFEEYKSIEERWQQRSQIGEDQPIIADHSKYDQELVGSWRSTGENGYKSIVERPRVDSFNEEVFPLPCCPHKHPEGSAVTKWDSPVIIRQTCPTRSSSQMLGNTSQSWRESLEPTRLQTRGGQGPPDFIEREIEEALRREQELKEQREARRSQVYSPQTLVEQANKMAVTQFYPQTKTDKLESRSFSSPRPTMRLSSIPLLSPQPWSPGPQAPSVLQSPSVPQSPSVVRTGPLPVRGLTETLLQDFEERRIKLKLDESAYAGIQPIDSVNNEVVESTRVTRHKNQRALQWEAGVFANLQDQ